ncbi:uncharacterized protein LOC119732539 [Patiria miniata]|nr:uncharacterized protein LOC119732539 [Patiria miniata]
MEKTSLKAVLFLIAVSLCSACTYVPSPPQGIVQRMSRAQAAFKGKVEAIHPWPTTFRWYAGFYNATFDVECVYKNKEGGPQVTKTVTVSMFGDNGAMCSRADVEVGEEYVVLGGDRYDTGALKVWNVNFQSGAEAVTPHVMEQVEGAYTCESPQA